jgi:hypothetical protein
LIDLDESSFINFKETRVDAIYPYSISIHRNFGTLST